MFGLFKKNKNNNTITLKAPVVGRCMSITEVPDEVFSSKMLGDGIGFDSADGVLYAPVDAEVLQVFPTKHAVVIKTKEGVELLLHIGIDTVSMKGEGFETYVKQGDNVKVGDRIELVATDDSWTSLQSGAKGTVYKIDEEQDLIWIEWDNGEDLALINGVDKFRVIKK